MKTEEVFAVEMVWCPVRWIWCGSVSTVFLVFSVTRHEPTITVKIMVGCRGTERQ